ncbi:MAG: LysR substrate-binding domain-containing protein [Paracoccaceae bacterium]
MTQPLPPLTWLRAFEAAARHLSFTLAADELHLTQAAISKHVRLLEHYLREPLFQRLPRSLALTPSGAAYLPKVQDAFARLGAGTAEVFGARRGDMLTVRAPVGYAVTWLAPRLHAFCAANPDVALRIVSSVWNEDTEGLRHDLDILYGVGRWPGHRVERLTWEQVEPVCAPSVASRLSVPDDLARETLVHVIGYQEGWATWLAAVGARAPDAGGGLQFDTTAMALAVAAAGGGVALGRSSMVQTDLASGRLVAPFGMPVTVEESFWLLSNPEGREHPHAALFRDWLLAEARR